MAGPIDSREAADVLGVFVYSQGNRRALSARCPEAVNNTRRALRLLHAMGWQADPPAEYPKESTDG